MAKNELTLREQAAIRLYIYTDGDIGIADLYRVAYNGDETAVSRIASIPSVASRWWRSGKVVDYYTREKAAYDAKREKERLQIEREVSTRVPSTEKKAIDYSVPSNQIAKLNEIINGASDPAEALDALKVVIGKQGELAPEKKTFGQQIRTYLPLKCQACPLYQEKRDQLQSIQI